VVAFDSIAKNVGPAGTVTLWASDVVKSVSDNCTAQNGIQLGIRRPGLGATGFPTDTAGKPKTTVPFFCFDSGYVEVWARDSAGNTSMDSTFVSITDKGGDCIQEPSVIAACAATADKSVIQELDWHLYVYTITPYPNNHIQETAKCLVQSAVPANSLFTIIPSKDSDPLNGVTTFDLVLINKHILGIEPLSSPFKIIAADANRSNSVSTFDVVELRKLILGIYTKLPNNTSWRFLPEPFAFAHPENPFDPGFPDSISGDLILSNSAYYNFTGIKTGDVNGNADPSLLPPPEPRAACALRCNDALLHPGQNARIALSLSQRCTLSGLQFALRFDPALLEITGLEPAPGIRAEDFEQYFARPEPGLLSCSWDDPAEPAFEAGAPVFYLNIKALQSAQLCRALQFDGARIRPEAYPAGGNTLPLRIDFLPAPGFDRDEIFPPAPNPSAGPVFIPLALAQPGNARVELFDLHGRLLYTHETDLPAGPQRLEIPREAFRDRERVLAYRVRAGEATACGKIARQ